MGGSGRLKEVRGLFIQRLAKAGWLEVEGVLQKAGYGYVLLVRAGSLL